MNATGRWLASAVVLAAFVVLARACSAADEHTPADAASGGVAGGDAVTDAPKDTLAPDTKTDATDATGKCPTTPTPDDVPAGWVRYPVFDCDYPYYVPPDPSLLPKGLQWENCTDVGPEPYSCRQLVLDWASSDEWAVGGTPRSFVEPEGKVVLQLVKSYWSQLSGQNYLATMSVVAEADGKVRQAFWSSAQKKDVAEYWLMSHGISKTKSSWMMQLLDGSTFTKHAAVAGEQTDPFPPILLEFGANDPNQASVRPGQNFYGLMGYSLGVRSWAGKDFGTVYQGGLDIVNPIWAGDALLWSANVIEIGQIWVWTESGGAKPLISFDDDLTRGVANAVTDGVDLVWVLGEERDLKVSPYYPKRSLMKAKFTTDPGALQPVRVRSYPDPYIWGHGDTPDAIGCGYAAFLLVPETAAEQLLIVRLSDGMSWSLKGPPDKHWYWGMPVALTCEELFTSWGKHSDDHLRRIRLDSLGPGVPPD